MTEAITSPDKLAYSMTNAADAADVSIKTIQRAIRSGHLRAKTIRGRGQGYHVRVLRVDLEAWLEGLPDADSY